MRPWRTSSPSTSGPTPSRGSSANTSRLERTAGMLLPAARIQIVHQIFKLSEFPQKRQIHIANRPVSLLGYDQLRRAPQILTIRLVNLFAKDEAHHVGVLLNRSRFTQVAHLRPAIPRPGLRRPDNLPDDRN